jgi:hypothetical protein
MTNERWMVSTVIIAMSNIPLCKSLSCIVISAQLEGFQSNLLAINTNTSKLDGNHSILDERSNVLHSAQDSQDSRGCVQGYVLLDEEVSEWLELVSGNIVEQWELASGNME